MANLRHLPHHANLQQFKKQAKELLKAFHQGEIQVKQLFEAFHPRFAQINKVKLTDAQLVLAKQHGYNNWKQLSAMIEALPYFRQLLEAFKSHDYQQAEQTIKEHPILLERKDILGRAVRHGNLEMVKLMYQLGANNVQEALGYIVYGDKREIAKYLVELGANIAGEDHSGPILVSACEVLNKAAFETILDLSEHALTKDLGHQCLAMLLSTYCRNPIAKRACIERLVKVGVEVPDTPVMALHRGNLNLLNKHLQQDSNLFNRTFSEAEIYPPEFGIQPGDGLHLAPLNGATLLHLAVEFDERAILQWILENSANPNITADIDEGGFGGHTALFHTTISYTWRDATKAEMLLKAGANPGQRATLKKQLRYIGQPHLERMYEFHNVTCIEFAKQFQLQSWVSKASIQVIKRYSDKV